MSVVVTGLGTLGAWGRGRDALAAALAAGVPHALPVDRTAGLHPLSGAGTAARIAALELAPYLSAGAARRMSLPSKLAIVAARMALEDAGWNPAPAGEMLGVALATAFGTAVFTERLLREVFLSGPESASPFLFAESVANAPAAQLAIAARAQGPNLTVTQREAGPLLALAQGAAQVALGRAPVLLAGDVEEAGALVHAVLDRYRALTRPDRDGHERPRPFAADRDGFLLAEGATVVVLEDEAAAGARGANVLARLCATASAFDPTATASDWGTGADLLVRTLRRALDRAGVAPASIDLVVSGASGAVRGDALEAATLRALWQGGTPPAVIAPKATTGEYGGGLLAAAMLALEGAAFAPPPAAADPAFGLALHRGGVVRARRILVSALGAGGSAAWAVLERP